MLRVVARIDSFSVRFSPNWLLLLYLFSISSMGRKIQGPKNREVRFTCSPGHVRKYLKDLSPQQKDYVRKFGFGSFLSMADFEIDKDLTLWTWLFQRFNCDTESLEFEGGVSIPVRPLVKSVLGIPSGPIKVVEGSYFDPTVYHRYYVGKIDTRGRCVVGRDDFFEKGVKYMHTAGKQICSETEEKQFCIAFMMAIIALYLAPNKNSSTGKPFFGAVQQVDKLSQMDWCDFTASYLFEGIEEFQQSDRPVIKVKGCVHILSVIFIDLVKNAALKIPEGFPRICIVTTLQKELVNSCSRLEVHRIEESIYDSVLDKTLKDSIIKNSTLGGRNRKALLRRSRKGPIHWFSWQRGMRGEQTQQGGYLCENQGSRHSRQPHWVSHHRPIREFPKDKIREGGKYADAGANQFGTTVEETTCNSSELMETHHYSLDTSTPSTGCSPNGSPSIITESTSHEDTQNRQERLIITANADSTHHHSVEQEHINFPRDGQQLLFNGPSSEPYTAQIDEGVQVSPDVSLERNRASPSMMEEGGRSAKKARVEQPSGHVDPAGVGAVVDTTLLNCPLCSRPFKPPVFQCKGGHLACSTCLGELPGIQCQKCEHGGTFDIHNMMMDTIVLSAKIKCSYDGCQS